MDAGHYSIKTAVFILCLSLLPSCVDRNTRFVTDISDVDLSVKIKRFDKDVLSCSIDSLYDIYGDFVNLYAFKVLNLRDPQDIELFKSDSIVSIIYADVENSYADVSDIESELTTAFRYFSYYFPAYKIPEFLFHVSGFNQSVVITDTEVSASLDLYLGSDYKYYDGLVNNYELPLMTRERLPLDMAYAWISTEFVQSDQRLLDNMLYKGKLLYMMMVMFPDRSEADILGYSVEQYAWAKLYEKNVWASLMEKKQLFSSDWRLISQLVNPAPFTQGFSQESPGRLGEFIGLQIIKSYMENNTNLTLYDMFSTTDGEKILRDSQYRP